MAGHVLVAWAISFLPPVFAATTAKHATPINTCCPPGHFLAIEDLQGSRQDPYGAWSPEESTIYDMRAREDPIIKSIAAKSILAGKWNEWTRFIPGFNAGKDLLEEKTEGERIDRHQHISRVFCLPDKNDLPSIDGLSGSSLPSPPYFATKEDWREGISVKIRVLAEDQVLQSKGLNIFLEICRSSTFFPGSRLPSCPGGPAELATIVLGEGELDTPFISRPVKWGHMEAA